MAKNIKYQFKYCIDVCFKEHMDKHSLKRTEGIGVGKIYSYSDRRNLIDFSANFSNFLKQNYPNVKWVKDITEQHIQSFFNTKSKNCTRATLEQYKSKFNKLQTLVNKTYGLNVNYSKGYIVPITGENTAKLRNISMSSLDYNKLLNVMSNSKSSAVNGIKLSGAFGLRVSELSKLQYRDLDLKKHVIHIVGSKGNRDRDIPIPKDKTALIRQIKGDISDNKRIIPLKQDSINKFLTRQLDKIGLKEKYSSAKTGVHSLRKMYSQEQYNKCRNVGMDIKTSIDKVSDLLGHGQDRYTLIKEYVENIW